MSAPNRHAQHLAMTKRVVEPAPRPPRSLAVRYVALAFLLVGLGFGVGLEKSIGTSRLVDFVLAQFEGDPDTADYPVQVISVSGLPDPNTSPYKSCLLCAQCEGGIDGVDGPFTAVFWGFRNREPSLAALLQPGMTIKVDAVPFEDAGDELQALHMADDSDNFDSPMLWIKSWESPQIKPTRPELPVITELLAQGSKSLVKAADQDFYFYASDRGVYRKDFWKLPGDQAPGSAFEAALDFHRALDKKGIKLVLVIAPQASSIYPDLATGMDYDFKEDGPVNHYVADFLAALQGKGVNTIDLTAPFYSNRWVSEGDQNLPICLPNDTHWSPLGAKLAAEQIAQFLQNQPATLLPSTPRTKPDAFGVSPEWGSWTGDFSEMTVVKNLKIDIPDHRTIFYKVTTSEPPATSKNILDPVQPEASVHLVGDSFASVFAEQNAGLHAHLVRQLGMPINVVAKGAGGPSQARRRWVDEGGYQSAKLVIWVVSELYLGASQQWQIVPLPPK